MFVKGVEVDGQPNLIQNLCSPVGGDASDTNKLNPIIQEKNLKLKIDCYNNLSGIASLFEHSHVNYIDLLVNTCILQHVYCCLSTQMRRFMRR
jgi:hypothetical protein